jgi:SAM-dependent methyltransferase
MVPVTERFDSPTMLSFTKGGRWETLLSTYQKIVRNRIRRFSRKPKHIIHAFDPKNPSLGGNKIGGDPCTYHPALWSFLVERFSVKSILDVGCGEGHCVKYFSDLGIRAVGFDGLQANIERAVVPITLHDLRSGPFIMPVDLVLCCEVVEHIEEKYLPNLLQSLANGRVIAMTHALPGQGGYHHVNCKPPSYWIKNLETLGYTFLPQETRKGISLIKASGRWTYFIETGLILERRWSP